jgi:hypothetical protein
LSTVALSNDFYEAIHQALPAPPWRHRCAKVPAMTDRPSPTDRAHAFAARLASTSNPPHPTTTADVVVTDDRAGWTDADEQALRELGILDPDILCTASTGVYANPDAVCPRWPDGAHRCHRPARHQRATPGDHDPTRDRADHTCGCGHVFTSVQGGVQALHELQRNARANGGAAALTHVLVEMKASGLPGYLTVIALVRDVARELKIDLGERS